MKVNQKFTYADVGTGPINFASITTSTPTEIQIRLYYSELFNADTAPVITFTPTGGTPLELDYNINDIIPGFGYAALYHSTPAYGFYTETSGEVKVELQAIGTPPTAGSVVVFLQSDK